MNETDMLKELARKARLEKHPRVDAADAVLRRIRSEAMSSAFDPAVMLRPLAWVAACSGVIAIAIVPIAVSSWNDWLYPLMSLTDGSGWGF